MLRNRPLTPLAGAVLALLLGAGAARAAAAETALIAFAPLTLADGGGAPLGQAILSYQGQTYEVLLNGLGVGGAKGVKASVTGEVLGLTDVADLEGPFVSELADAPTAEVSSNDLWLNSERGVSIHLHTDQAGVSIASGSDTVMVQFGQVAE
ncbi:hypothetical protein [uncultured Thiodictyon sp.]|jgi:hypothetical protein|uniref:hypothetical protein n=1 Tax=uncultured Thiodictyon sp. TaxID=1846217 RepID=UPI0025F0DB11|nr:hypothetical protein [uncultured Thiodictyon sp.]